MPKIRDYGNRLSSWIARSFALHGSVGRPSVDDFMTRALGLLERGHDDEAEPLLWKTVELGRTREGPGHPIVLAALARLETIIEQRGDAARLAEIRGQFRAANEARMRFLQASRSLGEAHNLEVSSDHERAAVLAREALELWEQDPPLTPGMKGIEHYLGLLGSIELSRGRFDEAEALLVRALASRGSAPPRCRRPRCVGGAPAPSRRGLPSPGPRRTRRAGPGTGPAEPLRAACLGLPGGTRHRAEEPRQDLTQAGPSKCRTRVLPFILLPASLGPTSPPGKPGPRSALQPVAP
jgi:tetratricopeptide (TPR) repeat protein